LGKRRGPTGASSTRSYERSVFVNCPFDAQYKPLLDAILFTIHDCGFIARTALEAQGSAETRLDKIVRIIRAARWSLHDVSRVQTRRQHPLPRFNMPFECGLALGLQRFGDARDRRRDFLILEAKPYRDKQTLSDLAGQDAAYHHDDPDQAIAAVRSFLAKKTSEAARGAAAIQGRYARFRSELPALARALEINRTEIGSVEYVAELLRLMIEWQRHHAEVVARG
jgi:hypothetical protein